MNGLSPKTVYPSWRFCPLLVGTVFLIVLIGCDQRNGTPENGGPDQPGGEPPNRAITTESGQAAGIADLKTAKIALAKGDLTAADSALRRHLITAPDDAEALQLAGDVAANLRDHDRAVANYRAALAARASDPSAPDARASDTRASATDDTLLSKLAVQLMAAGNAYDCLAVLQQRVEHSPQSVEARAEMVGLAAMLGLAPQSAPSLRWLAQHGQGDPDLFQVLAEPRKVKADEEWCEELLTDNPEDLRPQYGLAQVDATKMQWASVVDRLKPVLERHPKFVPAQTLYGLALVEQGKIDELAQWHRQLSPEAEQTAEYWLVVGLWAKNQESYEQSARCLWNAIRLDPAIEAESLPHLLFALKQLGHEKVDLVAQQVVRHTDLRDRLMTHFERGGNSQRAAMEIAKAMKSLGRLWEAEGWARLAVTLKEQPLADIRDQYLAVRAGLAADSPWQLADRDLSRQIDLSGLPEFDADGRIAKTTRSGPTSSGELRVADEAASRGLVHATKFAATPGETGHWIYQSVGGGVGAIDFDRDGWPDLAISVLDGHPIQIDSSPNRLFRNLEGQFVEVTTSSRYQDKGFGQGICVGDYNSDGFPDLFDANIGRNRLYRNNGDGTFSDVSDEVGLSGEFWTTCGLIADINGDGIADLYEVAYCAGSAPYEKACRNSKGISTCVPLDFDAERDLVWRGRNEGGFDDVSKQWMTQDSPGRGLGIVAGLMEQHPGLDLYIANDMTVNHMWSARHDDDGFRMVDVGMVSGLGMSGRSHSQASMGIAADDPDGDGDIDLFLTHFSDDHNTFYEQASPGLWIDRTFQVGLGGPSMPMLGFGTQWVDLDNNGTLELMILNGHVDDVDRADILYEMPPQLFQLDDQQRWSEVRRESLGDYFTQNHLGRALAKIDVDRDGRTDLVATEIYGSVALLMNRSGDSGRSVTFSFQATQGHRDAIGAKVSCRVGDRTITKQLLAGDGYMCSNQRSIRLGLGESETIQDVVVDWPSGLQESLGQLSSDAEYLLVEGMGEAFVHQQITESAPANRKE